MQIRLPTYALIQTCVSGCRHGWECEPRS